MPELSSHRSLVRMRRTAGPMICVLALGGLASPVLAQNVPAGLRACAAESDAGQRLDCYDREMARLSAPPAEHSGSPPPSHTDRPSAPAQAQPRPAVIARAAAPESARAPADSSATAPRRESPWKIFAGGASSRVTARITHLERWPDAMVLHLDNGQVWQQIGRASGDLGLQAGDSVTIEKHLGAYWLSSDHVSDMQVRLKPQ